MPKAKQLNMNKFKSTMKTTASNHKDWKTRIKSAVDTGDHKTADAAIKLLNKSREGLHKLIEFAEGHMTKAKAKTEQARKA